MVIYQYSFSELRRQFNKNFNPILPLLLEYELLLLKQSLFSSGNTSENKIRYREGVIDAYTRYIDIAEDLSYEVEMNAGDREAHLRVKEQEILLLAKPYFDYEPLNTDFELLLGEVDASVEELRVKLEATINLGINESKYSQLRVSIHPHNQFAIIEAVTFSDIPFLEACASGDENSLLAAFQKVKNTRVFRPKKALLEALVSTKEKESIVSSDIYYGIHLAVIFRRPESLDILLKNSYPVNQPSETKKVTALHLACEMGDMDLVIKLLDARADINARDANNLTPLHYGLRGHANPKLIKLLLERNADVYATDSNNRNVLHILATRTIPWDSNNQFTGMVYQSLNDQKEIVELLLKNVPQKNQLLNQMTLDPIYTTPRDYAFHYQAPLLLPLFSEDKAPIPGLEDQPESNLQMQAELTGRLSKPISARKKERNEVMTDTFTDTDMSRFNNRLRRSYQQTHIEGAEAAMADMKLMPTRQEQLIDLRNRYSPPGAAQSQAQPS